MPSSTLTCRNVANNNFVGTLPATLSQLRSLTEFKCNNNHLEGKIPSLIALQQGREFDFGFNRFSGTIPADMVELPELSSFTVSNNLLTGALPSKLNKLKLLQRLMADSNQLSSTIPESLASLPMLGELDLSSNHLTGAVPLGRPLATWYE